MRVTSPVAAGLQLGGRIGSMLCGEQVLLTSLVDFNSGKNLMRQLLLAVLLALPLLAPALAIADDPIHGAMQVFVVELKDERETLTEAKEVEPNQLVEYHLTYTNKSESNINGLTVVGPVPDGTTYVSNTANADVNAALLVSIDGGKTYETEPVIRLETKESGEVVEKVIPAEQYTHLKWQAQNAISADGGTQFYTYRVRVK